MQKLIGIGGGLVAAFLILSFYLRLLERRTLFFPYKHSEFDPAPKIFDEVFFPAGDGTMLHGWFVPARDARYTLLFCHGNAGNISHRLEKVKFFTALGLNVFIFDYRGYGKSAGDPSEPGVYSDVRGAYAWLAGKGIRPESVIGYGESIGGAVAIDLAREKPLAALITECTFSNMCDMARSLVPFIPHILLGCQFDSLDKVKDMRLPKLFMSSVNDEIVPFRLGKKLFEAAAEPKEFLVLNGGHNTAFFECEPKIAEAVSRLIRLLD